MVDMQEWLIKAEKLKTEYEDLYSWFIEEGLDKGEALSRIKDSERMEEYYWKFVEAMNLQISYKVEDLDYYGWKDLSIFGRNELLWDLGVDIKNFNYYSGERRIMEGTSLKMKEVIWGNERLDKEWCTKKRWDLHNFTYYASDEARDIYWWRRKN